MPTVRDLNPTCLPIIFSPENLSVHGDPLRRQYWNHPVTAKRKLSAHEPGFQLAVFSRTALCTFYPWVHFSCFYIIYLSRIATHPYNFSFVLCRNDNCSRGKILPLPVPFLAGLAISNPVNLFQVVAAAAKCQVFQSWTDERGSFSMSYPYNAAPCNLSVAFCHLRFFFNFVYPRSMVPPHSPNLYYVPYCWLTH